MSALTFHAHQGRGCESENCSRPGRWKMLLAGYPVPSASSYALSGEPALLCGPCKKKHLALWSELTQETPERYVEATVRDLKGRGSAPTFALWALKDAGFSRAARAAFRGEAA